MSSAAPLEATGAGGLILFAHGARDPRWAEPFEAVVAQLRATRPGLPVRLAYLELMAPSLADAAAELCALGCGRITVLPLFLGRGSHLSRDLPQQVRALHAAHPRTRFVLHSAVGEHPALVAAMAAVAAQALDHPHADAAR